MAARIARHAPAAERAPALAPAVELALPRLCAAPEAIAVHLARLWLNAIPSARRSQFGRVPCRSCGDKPERPGDGDDTRHFLMCEALWRAAARVARSPQPRSVLARIGLDPTGVVPLSDLRCPPDLLVAVIAAETICKVPMEAAGEVCPSPVALGAAARLAR